MFNMCSFRPSYSAFSTSWLSVSLLVPFQTHLHCSPWQCASFSNIHTSSCIQGGYESAHSVMHAIHAYRAYDNLRPYFSHTPTQTKVLFSPPFLWAQRWPPSSCTCQLSLAPMASSLAALPNTTSTTRAPIALVGSSATRWAHRQNTALAPLQRGFISVLAGWSFSA